MKYPEQLADMTKEHAGEQWEPSNGTEGELFIEAWCCNCARDKAMREGADFDECDDDEKCEIIGASFRGEAVEWQYDEGQADYYVGFYALPHPQGWEFRVANTNADPVWEEADQQAFAELAESCGVEL